MSLPARNFYQVLNVQEEPSQNNASGLELRITRPPTRYEPGFVDTRPLALGSGEYRKIEVKPTIDRAQQIERARFIEQRTWRIEAVEESWNLLRKLAVSGNDQGYGPKEYVHERVVTGRIDEIRDARQRAQENLQERYNKTGLRVKLSINDKDYSI